MTGTTTGTTGRRRWLHRVAGLALALGGLAVMLAGGGVLAAQWYAGRIWAATELAVDAARQLDAPAPRWLDAAEPTPTPRATATPRPATPMAPTPAAVGAVPEVPPAVGGRAAADARVDGQASVPVGGADLAASGAPVVPATAGAWPVGTAVTDAAPDPTPERRAPPEAVAIVGSEFRFLDPPEPGAQALVGLVVRNRADLPTGPLRLSLPTRWLHGWRVLAADPPVLDDRELEGGRRAFDFPGLDPDAEAALELHLVATDDAVDPPEIRLALVGSEDGPAAEVGSARPPTVAPRPRPGPARAVEIPRLGLRAAVVPTAWEPPNFVVGQLRQTANLSEGNTVLIGHLTGLAGNVFARLDQLEPGDEIVAISRGLEYRFVVSETLVLPGDDSVPIQPTEQPRLTLMTCAGDWDPIGHDYSHRLWVVAEPPELAEATLAGGEPGPLTRLLGLAPEPTILPPTERGPSPKEQPPVRAAAGSAAVAEVAPEPTVEITQPADGAAVGSRAVVRGRRLEDAAPSRPLWLAIRAEVEGGRWFIYGRPLAVRPDGSWEAELEIGGGPGIRHQLVVAAVDPATDARLRRHADQRPGEPLSILPDAFAAGATVTVERR